MDRHTSEIVQFELITSCIKQHGCKPGNSYKQSDKQTNKQSAQPLSVTRHVLKRPTQLESVKTTEHGPEYKKRERDKTKEPHERDVHNQRKQTQNKDTKNHFFTLS